MLGLQVVHRGHVGMGRSVLKIALGSFENKTIAEIKRTTVLYVET